MSPERAVPRNPSRWLFLIHQIPAKPDYLRVKVRRRLAQLGAVALKNSVYFLAASPEGRSRLGELAREILRLGGEALVCQAELLEGLADGSLEDLLRRASDAEYTAITAEAKRLASTLRRVRASDEAGRRRFGQQSNGFVRGSTTRSRVMSLKPGDVTRLQGTSRWQKTWHKGSRRTTSESPSRRRRRRAQRG